MQNEIERKFLVNPKLLDIESQNIILPDWIIKEITHDDRFYNKNLASRPFKSWSLSEIKDCYSEY